MRSENADYCSVFGSEMIAIDMALDFVLEHELFATGFRVGGDEGERSHGSDLIQIKRISKKKKKKRSDYIPYYAGSVNMRCSPSKSDRYGLMKMEIIPVS
ncbi:hypothetical protein AVEN_216016-1 [Araneus ventricosus]|uniref:Uncharacterized protein n=1 Tax=Araneus ventricosus TaxID=182803 RepID=A0A4Y2BQB5_ARAVE|nr:hypothetical protein AVEN_216016-1 [Araneus ventricosus]